MTVSSTSDPPNCQHSSGVGVGVSVGEGVRVDQEVGEGSGGTVMEGVREGWAGDNVSAGRAAEQPAIRKIDTKITARNNFSLMLPCIIRRNGPAEDRLKSREGVDWNDLQSNKSKYSVVSIQRETACSARVGGLIWVMLATL